MLYLKAFRKRGHKFCTEVNTNHTGHPSNKCSENSSIPSWKRGGKKIISYIGNKYKSQKA